MGETKLWTHRGPQVAPGRGAQGSGRPALPVSTRVPPSAPLSPAPCAPLLTCLAFAQRLLQPIGPHILGVLGGMRVRVREVVRGGAPASLLGPGRHAALGPGPPGPPAAPPAAGRPVSPVGAGDRSVPAPPAAPHFSGGPQGAGLGPPKSAGRGAGGGGAGPGRGGVRPRESAWPRGAARPPLPSPCLAGPPFLCLPPPGGVCGAGRRMLRAEVPPAPPRALSPPPPPPLRLPPPPRPFSPAR